MAIMRRPAVSTLPSVFESEMNDVFRRFFGTPAMTEGWLPAVRVEETDNEIVVLVEMPGVEASDLTISIEGRELTLKGERKVPEPAKGAHCYVDEIVCGHFQRTVLLPAEVVNEKTTADYKAGLARITMPKAPSARRIKIPIQVARD